MPRHPHFDEIISKFTVKHISGDVHSCLCPNPGHGGDDKPSLHITPMDDGKILVHCKACGKENTDAVLAAVGLKMQDLFPPKEHTHDSNVETYHDSPIIARYPYVDTDGTLLYQVCRTKAKEFPQRSPNGSGGWKYKGAMDGITRVPYQLPRLLEAIKRGLTIYVPEGEEDVRTLKNINQAGTCNSGGASNWPNSISPHFKGADVVFLPDNDTPGCEHVMRAAVSITPYAKHIRYAQLPGLPRGGDLRDWIEKQKHTKEEFLEFIATDAHEWVAGTIIEPSPEARARKAKPTDRPQIKTSSRHLRDITTDTIAALEQDHEHNALYIRMGRLVRLRTQVSSKITTPIIEDASTDIVRSLMSQSADYIKVLPKGDEAIVFPPIDVARDVLARGQWEFPQLDAVTESPVMRSDGSILAEPGYDESTCLFYAAAGTNRLHLPEIPKKPTQANVSAAVAAIADILADFPFVTESDRTNLIAMMLTQVIRPAIDGLIPMGIVNAPQPGAGKGLLVKIISIIATGKEMQSTTAPGAKQPEEWTKLLTAILAAGTTMIVFDNADSVLDSPDLASFLTASDWKGRILGQSKIIAVPNRATVLVTGNNVRVAGDIARRCYWSTINPNTSTPELRTGFRHANLCKHVQQHRGEILAALFTLARAWFAAGQPAPTKSPIVGSFEEWARIIGGALETAGYADFLGNAEEIRAKSDVSANENEVFLEAIYDVYRGLPFTTKELNVEIKQNPTLEDAAPDYLMVQKGKSEASFVRGCGQLLHRINGRHYGKDNITVLQMPTKQSHRITWYIECDDDREDRQPTAASYQLNNLPNDDAVWTFNPEDTK
jgi:hypothetical protein